MGYLAHPEGKLGGAQTRAQWVLDPDENAATVLKRELDQAFH